MRISLSALLLLSIALACGDDDAPVDTGARDVGGSDASRDIGADTAVALDTGTDASTIDVGGTDTGGIDASEDTGGDSGEADVGVDAEGGGVNCDVRDVRCRIPAPACRDGQVPEVVGTCYGECVDVGECSCTEAAECGDELLYVCRRDTGRCTPPL